ncbi:hypothetical protein BB560_004353 [Smittium megazygosporum]|uniref:Arf-GAP with coiled-coil, ANK repeat and PH domain-containing protein n=1 Tax=Smittium megazygosporum TaxID=133381 RepID=A0A2T9Z9G5_9FUNG|nr:hypothetical protein BB560_004353 [Smittium megazygosporum]
MFNSEYIGIPQLGFLSSKTSCLENSPNYNNTLETFDTFTNDLFTKNDELIKLAEQYQDAIMQYSSIQQKMHSKLSEFIEFLPLEKAVSDVLKTKYLETVNKVETLQTNKDLQILEMLQTGFDIISNESSFTNKIKQDYKKSTYEYNRALSKYLSTSPNDTKLDQIHSNYLNYKNNYFSTKHDYAMNLGSLSFLKVSEFVDQLLMATYIHISYFNNANDMFSQLQPEIHKVSNCLNSLQVSLSSLIQTKSMDYESAPKKSLEYPPSLLSGSTAAGSRHSRRKSSISEEEYKMSGYLYLKNKTSNWARMWFEIHDLNLVYYADQTLTEKHCIPLLLSKINDSPELLKKLSIEYNRQFLFEIISPQQKYIFQSESELEMKKWMSSIKLLIRLSIYHFGQSNPSSATLELNQILEVQKKSTPTTKPAPIIQLDSTFLKKLTKSVEFSHPNHVIESILKLDGNRSCADCGASNPTWAILNFGVLVCINCSGIHRSFGVQISKVRSIQLDKIDPEHLHILQRLGNSAVNKFLDPDTHYVNSSETSADFLQAYISNKYYLRKYLLPLPTLDISSFHDDSFNLRLNQLLFKSTTDSDLSMVLRALLLGADPNFIDPSLNISPLAVAVSNADYGATELLLMYNADINMNIHPKASSEEIPQLDINNSKSSDNTSSVNEVFMNKAQMETDDFANGGLRHHESGSTLSDSSGFESSIGRNNEYKSLRKKSQRVVNNDADNLNTSKAVVSDTNNAESISIATKSSTTSLAGNHAQKETNDLHGTKAESILEHDVGIDAISDPREAISNSYVIDESGKEIELIEGSRADQENYFKLYGGTAVHMAACYNNAAMIVLLIKRKADVNMTNDAGLKPIDVAILFGNAMSVIAFRYFSFVEIDNSLSLETITNALDQDFEIPQLYDPNKAVQSQLK